MTAQINPYLYFNGNCKEAMTFYQECLGGALSLMTVSETPMADKFPAEAGSQIMHANLMREGVLLLMASDNLMGSTKQGSSITLSVSCSSENELNTFFSRLSDGGNVSHPPSREFWGALYAQLTDKFGISWMLSYDEKFAS